jgi:hypothetical protein
MFGWSGLHFPERLFLFLKPGLYLAHPILRVVRVRDLLRSVVPTLDRSQRYLRRESVLLLMSLTCANTEVISNI